MKKYHWNYLWTILEELNTFLGALILGSSAIIEKNLQ